MHTYSETTKDIEVSVTPVYLENESSPEESVYVFAYNVEIKNKSDKTVQLISRHWIITDGDGRTEEVSGPGVIGEQPTLAPGDSHKYQSFCPLRTPTGNMRGSYQMKAEKDSFDIKVPLFFLRSETILH